MYHQKQGALPMPEAGLKELLEAGVHFGHQTRRWNPNMRRYIFGELDGIHIIDLIQTEALLENARRFAGELASGGGTVLFVGTKKQARGPVEEWADRCKMPYVNQRWLGGLLTNFNTMSARIARLHELTGWREEGKLGLLPTKGGRGRASSSDCRPRSEWGCWPNWPRSSSTSAVSATWTACPTQSSSPTSKP